MNDKKSFTCILASSKNGTLYIGVTGNLEQRIYQHKNNKNDGFTKWYGIKKLVHFEVFENIKFAIHREKQLKRWDRQWKINLIEKENPQWLDLYEGLFE